MDYLLQLFKGMGSERRMGMVELLLERGEMHIEDIAGTLKIPLATCCRNLKILERVYVVNSRRKNGRAFYSLNSPSKHPYNSLIIALIKKYRKKKR
jgi:predicted transcriptional regulator